MHKHKFNLGERVLVKSLNKVGIITESEWLMTTDHIIVRHTIAIEGLNFDKPLHSLGSSKAAYTKVQEHDLQKLLKDLEESIFVNTAVPENLLFDTSYKTKELKCECGKEKHGFANHSDWCEIKE